VNFCAVSSALGDSPNLTQRFGGFFKQYLAPKGRYNAANDTFLGQPPFGNSPEDYLTIALGIQYYNAYSGSH